MAIRSGGVTVRAGLFDDPFFFDSQGLRESRASGTLDIRNTRNFFGGKNITAVVLQIPRSAICPPNRSAWDQMSIWMVSL